MSGCLLLPYHHAQLLFTQNSPGSHSASLAGCLQIEKLPIGTMNHQSVSCSPVPRSMLTAPELGVAMFWSSRWLKVEGTQAEGFPLATAHSPVSHPKVYPSPSCTRSMNTNAGQPPRGTVRRGQLIPFFQILCNNLKF